MSSQPVDLILVFANLKWNLEINLFLFINLFRLATLPVIKESSILSIQDRGNSFVSIYKSQIYVDVYHISSK
jgi:hypothetical protein